jgi:hypothetical protein
MKQTVHEAQLHGFDAGFEAGHKFGYDHALMLSFFLLVGILLARAMRRRRRG